MRAGAEIECKVWPAALLLARWLWCHPWLLEGRRVLELGAGVGTAGLAACLAGASRVVITDINATALGLELPTQLANLVIARLQLGAQLRRLLPRPRRGATCAAAARRRRPRARPGRRAPQRAPPPPPHAAWRGAGRGPRRPAPPRPRLV